MPGLGERLRTAHRRRRAGHVGHRLDRVVRGAAGRAAHVHRAVREIARPLLGGEDDAAAAVGDHAAVELVQRIGDEPRRQHVVDGDRVAVHRVGIAGRVLARLHRDRRELLGRGAVLVHVPLRGHRVRADEREPGRELVGHRQRHRHPAAAAAAPAGAERAARRRQLVVAVDDRDRVDVAVLDRAVRVHRVELEARAADARRLEPARREPEVLGEHDLVHAAVARRSARPSMSAFSRPASSSARRNDCASSMTPLRSGVTGPSEARPRRCTPAVSARAAELA